MAERAVGATLAWKWQPAAAFGLLLVLVAGWLFALVPGRLDARDAWEAAPACAAGEPAADCRAPVPATVVRTEDEARGKGVRYWLVVTEAGADTERYVRMQGREPVYDAVRPGDEVTLTYWRGEIREVGFATGIQSAYASPFQGWQLPLGFGLMMLSFGLSVLWMAWWIRYRYPRTTHAVPWQSTVVVGAVLLGTVGVVASMASAGVPQALLVTAAAIPPVAGLTALLGWWWLRRARHAERVEHIVAVLPGERMIVRATVQGDVSYSRPGFDFLVLGDGRPAATPDPAGRVALRALPEALTVLGVRPFRPGDHNAWPNAYGWDGVVIECRDGAAAVLIAARRRDAPSILGALATAPVAGSHPAPR
ncbi:hypothetical protein [Streptomyces mayteni]